MQKYHDEPKQYKGYLKSALVAVTCDEPVHEARGHVLRANARDDDERQQAGLDPDQVFAHLGWEEDLDEYRKKLQVRRLSGDTIMKRLVAIGTRRHIGTSMYIPGPIRSTAARMSSTRR